MGAPEDAPGLIGRREVWAELVALLDGERPEHAAMVLAGEAGMGKTALLASFARRAGDLGHPVLRVAGDSGMPGVAYAALRVLLGGPDGPDLTHLSAARRQALRSALTGDGPGADVLVLRAAVLAALGELAGDRPVVLVVDDVDRVDAPSFDVLLTVASVIALGQMPLIVLFAARTERVPVELAELLPAVVVPPLSALEAERLLDGAPAAPVGAARLEILRRAGGNPLALREFADWADLPGDRPGVADVFARRVRELPEVTRWALALAAAGERDLAVLAQVDPATTAAWSPAAEAGLITLTETVVRFRHPLVEYAVLEAAGPTTRARAHRALAAGLTDPRRALWHRAAAVEGPDPQLAAELAGAAAVLDGSGLVTAVTMLEQAAALLPAELRGPMLLDAGARAGAVGRLRWARDLLDRVRAGHDPAADPVFDVQLRSFGSWLETMQGRLEAATDLLVGMMAAGPLTMGTSTTAAFPAFLLGHGRLTEALTRASADLPVDQPWVFPLAVCRPGEEVRALCLLVPEADSAADQNRSARTGAAAMLADEPEKAVRLLSQAVAAVAEGTATGVHLAAPGAAGWALIDLGHWVEAEDRIVPLLSSPVAAEAPLIRAGTYVQLAVIALLRGRRTAAAELIARSPLDPFAVPAFALRLRWAQGVAAAAAGEPEEAYGLLASAFAVRHDWRLLVLPDLVAAGPREEAAAAVAEAEAAYAGRWLSTRARGRLDAARALLDDDLTSAAALLDAPEAGRRPFERATLATEVADRLRRRQQPRPARDRLVDALESFERMGAAGWAARVSAQLRGGAPVADPFATLTAQQEQIVRLAANGLSNREIGERLFLSPRTIGSHLYRIFPQLGVANRTQLGELLTARGTGR